MLIHTCPNDETLMDFLERRLPAKARKRVEIHLSRCDRCREQVTLCADVLAAEDGATHCVPEQVTQEAVDAVLAGARRDWTRKLGREARRWAARGAAVLERLTFGPLPASLPVRSSGETVGPAAIRRERLFEDLRVTIDIERSGAGAALIRVQAEALPTAGGLVRVALFRKEREAASGVLGPNPLLFEEIPLGRYALVFVTRGRTLGQYAFEITDGP
jgi:anti-sigma factor RsiW